jgi:hypothetical protein
MGTVYLAKDTALNRPVALKVLLGSLARNPSMVRSFYREAQAAAPLRHPSIVRIYSAGVEAGTPYIAMEYVAGEPLDRFLRRKGTVNWQAALYVGAQLAQALNCAHTAGVIHRDVKPANILLDRRGRICLADFGIARVATLDARGRHGAGIIGTPAYMSPEQCEGADLNPATDLYSLGVVLFQMLAGYPPFRAETSQALVKQILSDDAARLNKLRPDIPDDVARLVAHLLQKEPDARPRSAAQVAKMIERIQAEEGGRSAVPEALSAFVREQAVESNLRLMTPLPQRGSKSSARTAPPGNTRQCVPARMLAGVVAVALVVLGFAYATLHNAGHGLAPAPPMTAFRFSEDTDGTLRASAKLDGFEFARLHWAGESLLVEAHGRHGSLLHGATGLLAVAPDEQLGLSVHAPHAPFSAEPAQWYPVPLAYRIPAGTQGTLSNSVLMFRPSDPNTAENNQIDLLSQPITNAAPRMMPVHRGALAFATKSQTRNGFSPTVALHPDGEHLCIALQDSQGGAYLAEFNIADNADPGAMETRVSTTTPAIVPGSMQYTSDGSQIAYMRETEDSSRELWITPRLPGSMGVLLSVGRLDEDYALRPDGATVVVAVYGPEDARPELRVIDTATGTVVARPGRGTVGVEAWLPGGDAFVASFGNPLQAYLIHTRDSYDAEPITRLEHGIRGNAAVSQDGRWIAAIANRGADQSLIFLPSPRGHTQVAQAIREVPVTAGNAVSQ